MAPQDAPRTRPRRLQDASKTTSNHFESEIAAYIAFGTQKLHPNGFQKLSKMLPERTLTPCEFRQTIFLHLRNLGNLLYPALLRGPTVRAMVPVELCWNGMVFDALPASTSTFHPVLNAISAPKSKPKRLGLGFRTRLSSHKHTLASYQALWFIATLQTHNQYVSPMQRRTYQYPHIYVSTVAEVAKH